MAIVLEVDGPLNGPAVGALKSALDEAVRQSQAGSVVIVDLSRVSRVDSETVGYLVTARNSLRGREASLAVAGLTPHVREVFEVTRLDRLFPIFDSSSAALSRLGPPGATVERAVRRTIKAPPPPAR